MKRVVLIKPGKEIQAAHLYEHLFLYVMIEFFDSRKLLNYLDYRWLGWTYNGGFIYIDLVLISIKAKKLENEVINLKIDLDEKHLRDTVGEIIAETKKAMSGDPQKLIAILKELDSTPWLDLEDVDVLDTSKYRRSNRALWITNANAPTKLLRNEIILSSDFSKKNKELLPLFHIIANSLLDNLANQMRKRHHGYVYQDNTISNSRATKEVVIYRLWEDEGAVKINEEVKSNTAFIKAMLENGLADRIVSYLNENSGPGSMVSPNELSIYEKYQVLIGQKGWKRIATKPNIQLILDHITLKVTFENKNVEQKLLTS